MHPPHPFAVLHQIVKPSIPVYLSDVSHLRDQSFLRNTLACSRHIDPCSWFGESKDYLCPYCNFRGLGSISLKIDLSTSSHSMNPMPDSPRVSLHRRSNCPRSFDLPNHTVDSLACKYLWCQREVAAFYTQAHPLCQFLTIVSVASIFWPGYTLVFQVPPCTGATGSDCCTLSAESIDYETACLSRSSLKCCALTYDFFSN
jgi:hypothetical protein